MRYFQAPRVGSLWLPAVSAGIFALHGCGFLEAAEGDEPEPWVNSCEILTANVLEGHAASVASGVKVKKHEGGWLWSPQVQDAKGVLVVHPTGRNEPARIDLRLDGRMRDAKKFLQVTARASNHRPGVKIQMLADGVILDEAQLETEWQTRGFSLASLPQGTNSVAILVHPVGWMYEYCYIDSISVTDKAPAMAPQGPGMAKDAAGIQTALRKSLMGGAWVWDPAEGVNGPAWETVEFRDDGSFKAFKGGVQSYESTWRISERGGVEIMNKEAVGTVLEFDGQHVTYEARAVNGKTLATGRPKDWKGLSIDRALNVGQDRGGKSATMEDLKFILRSYGEAKMDLAPYPDTVVYRGKRLQGEQAGEVKVGYLMPLGEAERVLFERRPTANTSRAVAPGFPRGLKLWTYDIRTPLYNRVTIMTDRADRVVAVQLKAENVLWIPDRDPAWRKIHRDFHSFDFIRMEERGRGQVIHTHVRDSRGKGGGFIIINTGVPEFKETTTCYLPEPIVNIILHNLLQSGERLR